MFKNSSKYYDLIYGQKDYQKEADIITNYIRQYHPQATTVLDVACGTHEHVKYLTNHYQIDGLDINQEFLDIAAAKNPQGTYHRGDMINFKVNKQYDVIMCVFSSIGYVQTLDNLKQTIANFKNHLSKNGIIIVEPWFTPDSWFEGKTHMATVDNDDVKICRMNLSETRGKCSYIKFHYLIGDKNGVEHFTEEHELGLFTQEEMLNSFKSANLDVHFDSVGLLGRGTYLTKLKM